MSIIIGTIALLEQSSERRSHSLPIEWCMRACGTSASTTSRSIVQRRSLIRMDRLSLMASATAFGHVKPDGEIWRQVSQLALLETQLEGLVEALEDICDRALS